VLLALASDPVPPGVGTPALWAGFVAFVLVVLALDLGLFHRKAHAVGFREALGWSAVWATLALAFSGFVTWRFGGERGIEFLTGYLIEQSLSVDNLFVFVVIFGALGIPPQFQHRVLFWGILSALVLRAGMILAGAAMLARFHWLVYVFGAFLVLTGVKLYLQRAREMRVEDSWALRLARRLLPSTPHLSGERFFTRENGRRVATPLLMALILIELTDVVFAVDSIPAVLAITTDPFVVFTSNLFAILGLRSLYFLLGGLLERFRHLKVGLAAVLVFVGAKMTLVDVVHVPPALSLVAVLLILGGALAASLLVPRPEPAPVPRAPTSGPG
jgi:tellurite resistance protein TerC